MKFKDLIAFSFRNTYREKTSFLIFLFIMTAFVSCLFSFSYKKSYEYFNVNYYYKTARARFLGVGYDYYKEDQIKNRDATLTREERIQLAEKGRNRALEVIFKNKHIIGEYDGQAIHSTIKQIDKNTIFLIYGVPQKNNIPIVLGENIDAYGEDEPVMICPINVILYDENGNYNMNQSVNIQHLLNQTVDMVSFLRIPSKWKIVGFYDTYESQMDGKSCYASYKNVEKIVDLYRNPKKTETSSEGATSVTDSSWDIKNTVNYTGEKIEVLIDDNRNLDEVIRYLEKNHLVPDFKFNLPTEFEEKVLNSCNRLTVAMIFLAGLTVGYVFFQNYAQNKQQYFLYHSLGYKRTQILKMIFVENTILIFLGFLPAIGITQILLRLYKYFVLGKDYIFYYMDLSLDLSSSAIALGVGLLIPILLTIIQFVFTTKKSFEEVGK